MPMEGPADEFVTVFRGVDPEAVVAFIIERKGEVTMGPLTLRPEWRWLPPALARATQHELPDLDAASSQ